MGSGSPRPAAWCWSRWTFESQVLHDARLKGVRSTTHPLRGDEIGAIKAWLVERTRMKAPGRTFFLSEQRKPLHCSTVNLACVNTARRPSYR
jgi:type 1 fimbriae regulatory protein FimB